MAGVGRAEPLADATVVHGLVTTRCGSSSPSALWKAADEVRPMDEVSPNPAATWPLKGTRSIVPCDNFYCLEIALGHVHAYQTINNVSTSSTTPKKT
jgi:hypothetical protein